MSGRVGGLHRVSSVIRNEQNTEGGKKTIIIIIIICFGRTQCVTPQLFKQKVVVASRGSVCKIVVVFCSDVTQGHIIKHNRSTSWNTQRRFGQSYCSQIETQRLSIFSDLLDATQEHRLSVLTQSSSPSAKGRLFSQHQDLSELSAGPQCIKF